LAEILLMKPRDAAILVKVAVVTLDEQERYGAGEAHFDLRHRQAQPRRKAQAEQLVFDSAVERLNERLEDMGCRTAALGKADVFAVNTDGEFVLRPGKRKPDPFFA